MSAEERTIELIRPAQVTLMPDLVRTLLHRISALLERPPVRMDARQHLLEAVPTSGASVLLPRWRPRSWSGFRSAPEVVLARKNVEVPLAPHLGSESKRVGHDCHSDHTNIHHIVCMQQRTRPQNPR